MKKLPLSSRDCRGNSCLLPLERKCRGNRFFDHGQGQATKAAAGIISPWFSKRRNKAWYKMARLGADFYVDLLDDLEKSGQKIDFISVREFSLEKGRIQA